jgi:hypothetical protein
MTWFSPLFSAAQPATANDRNVSSRGPLILTANSPESSASAGYSAHSPWRTAPFNRPEASALSASLLLSALVVQRRRGLRKPASCGVQAWREAPEQAIATGRLSNPAGKTATRR